MSTDPIDYLPISMLNQLEYCERRFYLMHVRGEMDVNAHVLEGALRHETAHTPSRESEDGIVAHRRVYIWSDDLRIAGFTDLVEEVLEPQHNGQPQTERVLIPVEYKKGRMGKWLNDHIQLCAQALCIAERTGAVVPKGYIFYFGSRHRQEVIFTPELRQRTVESIHRAHALAQSGSLPPPIANYNKCRDCSLEPICLPREVQILEAA
ncbi:MAG: CRISPR-associated protein Cas4 [Anaerolineales bacterium]